MQKKQRLRLVVQGAVQGVGFRPFVYHLAVGLALTGWVRNSSAGVVIEIEGAETPLAEFRTSLEDLKPVHSEIYGIEASILDPVGYSSFQILQSLEGDKTTVVLPDIATCAACRAEMFDPADRRYHYPFTNCTHCGPRFTIIETLPYDRPNTSMKGFVMCPSCRDEYEDPANRRFHAQPNACPRCGPQLAFWTKAGVKTGERDEALAAAGAALRSGQILAVKGIGGFHLMVAAANEEAVRRLRRLKDREEKPFALMYPSFERIEEDCAVSESEKRVLTSPAAPIVLLRRKKGSSVISETVAPGNPYLGVMLPYSPLHHLLLAQLGFPLVATSGNLKDEPICVDEAEAVIRLGPLVNGLLVHNRPIVRPVDDSVTRVMAGREMVMRRARGYAPLPVVLNCDESQTPPVLAVGGQLKNTVALSVRQKVFVSQHLGDLEAPEALDGFERAIESLLNLYDAQPLLVACDAHPGYESTRYARSLGIELVEVQHHYAHVLSCMAENELTAPLLGVAWDGTGYGPDGTVWGGEFLAVSDSSFARVAHLAPFYLPGAEQAVREPRRSALGVLYQLFGDALFTMDDIPSVQAFAPAERRVLRNALQKRINAPLTTSVGRLFDAVASILDIRHQNSFEGQAAMELESACEKVATSESYTFHLSSPDRTGQGPVLINWQSTIEQVLEDCRRRTDPGLASARFHNTLVEVIAAVARRLGMERVALTGGCFQNRYLTEHAIERLEGQGFRVYWHQRVPPNDGGIAVGQIAAAIREKGRMKSNVFGSAGEDRKHNR